jgi:hypothetical protein
VGAWNSEFLVDLCPETFCYQITANFYSKVHKNGHDKNDVVALSAISPVQCSNSV